MIASKEKVPFNIFNIFIIGTTMALISSFLSGKIIPIPHGTHEGGVISAIGISIILVAMSIVIIIGNWLMSKKRITV